MTLPNSYEHIVSIELPKILQAFEKFLRPQDRGFELVYSGLVPNHAPTILYQSNQCKTIIRCRRDRPYDPLEAYVYYGRLHAPLDEDIIEWHGEKCHCWHSLHSGPLLAFLDGLSPTEAEKLTIARISRDVFELSKGMGWTTAEFLAREQAMIWEHYGQHLFDLFDVSYPNLWEEYVNFLKEYSRILQEKDNALERFIYLGRPLRYKIC
jgi:hypothetical protein